MHLKFFLLLALFFWLGWHMFSEIGASCQLLFQHQLFCTCSLLQIKSKNLHDGSFLRGELERPKRFWKILPKVMEHNLSDSTAWKCRTKQVLQLRMVSVPFSRTNIFGLEWQYSHLYGLLIV